MSQLNSFVLRSTIVACLWVAACTHSGTPSAATPQKEETRQNSQPATASSVPQKHASQEELKPGQTAPSDTATAPEKETATTPAADLPSPADTAAAKPQEAGEKPGVRRTAAPETAESELEDAREKLRASQATEARISSDLERLEKSGKASPEVIRDYEIYRDKVQAMVAENRQMVEQMEAAQARYSSAVSGTASPDDLDKMLDPAIAEEQAADEIAALDHELDTSLAKFDNMLLQEMDAIRARSAKKMQDLAEEAADAAKRLRTEGVDVNTSESTSPAQTEGGSTDTENQQADEKGQPEKDQDMAGEEREAGPATASGDEDHKGGQDPAKRDQQRNYDDDDIVARQLREAAENETDPELKEKLWREYEEYKQNKR